jgi:hypothetical protein
MYSNGPRKKFREFLFDSAIPSGVRVIISTFILLFFYFFTSFAVLATLIMIDYHGFDFNLILISSYSFVICFVLPISIYSLWSTHLKPKFWGILGSAMLIGYSIIWFFLGPFFVPLAFIFIVIGSVSLLYVMTGKASSEYYRKTEEQKFLNLNSEEKDEEKN